ncbi:MAG: M10 family metallopeptidase [Pseudomonadota bacterium]
MGGVVPVPAGSSAELNALLWGSAWAGPITFAFADDLSSPSVRVEGGARPDAALQNAVRAAFAEVRSFTGLDVREGGAGADIKVVTASALVVGNARIGLGEGAYAFYPAASPEAGDMAYGRALAGFEPGGFAYRAVLHEVGHALGLKHPSEPGAYAVLPPGRDGPELSVMSARSAPGAPLSDGLGTQDGGFARTFMPADIAALQHIYGADFSDPSNTRYAFDPREAVKLMTVWDGGGRDTYDFSRYRDDLDVSLAPGDFSVTGQEPQLNLAQEIGRGDDPIYAEGAVHNAWLFKGDRRSLIENAKGGRGDDEITGNVAHNRLEGGRGEDSLIGAAGRDTLLGGPGDDVLRGGTANDQLFGAGGADRLHGAGGRDLLVGAGGHDWLDGGRAGDRLNGGGGRDTLSGGTGHDHILGGKGADRISGGLGDDVLGGGAQGDRLLGGGGHDTLVGGGGGYDVMTGGPGGDTFRFAAPGTVTDFGRGNDVLDLPGGVGAEDAVQVGRHTHVELAGGGAVRLLWVRVETLTDDAFV